MKKSIFLSLMLFLSFSVFAQQSAQQEQISVIFNEKEHDFGTVREEDGKVVTEFKFVNTSQFPVTIKSVKASCGCTTPTYSREPILPNGEGKITVAFGASGRPGSFNKNVTVQIGTDNDTRTETLVIKGKVLSKPKSIEESYPHKIGDLLFRENTLNMGSIVKGEVVEKAFEVYNNSDSEQTLTFDNVPAYMTISVDGSPKIAPQQNALIKVVFNSGKSKNWGSVSDKIQLKINGKVIGEYVFNAVLIEDFSKITSKQLQEAPAVVLNPKNLNLTTVKIGTKRTSKIQLTNNGKSPLIIRDIKNGVNYLKVSAAKNEVAAGKTIVLTVTVDASKLNVSKFRREVQLITNDPSTPVTTLMVEWQTEK